MGLDCTIMYCTVLGQFESEIIAQSVHDLLSHFALEQHHACAVLTIKT